MNYMLQRAPFDRSFRDLEITSNDPFDPPCAILCSIYDDSLLTTAELLEGVEDLMPRIGYVDRQIRTTALDRDEDITLDCLDAIRSARSATEIWCDGREIYADIDGSGRVELITQLDEYDDF